MKNSGITLAIVSLVMFAAFARGENAWIRFTPQRPGNAVTPGFTNGWQVIETLDYKAADTSALMGAVSIAGPMGPATHTLVQDVINETVFTSAEIVLHTHATQTRLLLERVQLAQHEIDWQEAGETPTARSLLLFEAITYIYEPAEEDITGTYSEVDLVTEVGSAGEYQPRTPDTIPVFGARLTRDPQSQEQFLLSWESEPGIQYEVEFTDDLADPHSWQTVSGNQFLTEEGRQAGLSILHPKGFYRIRERQ